MKVIKVAGTSFTTFKRPSYYENYISSRNSNVIVPYETPIIA